MTTLGLTMIVKNEAESIAATLASCIPHCDVFTIVDTGSTDGTQEIVKQLVGGDSLYSAEFKDFSQARNVALDLAEDRAAFTLMLSGNETLHAGNKLRAFCEERLTQNQQVYHVNVHFGSTHYRSPRLSGRHSRWRYRGATHEVLIGPNGETANEQVPEAFVVHDTSTRAGIAFQRRWELDRVLLADALAKNPGDTRSAFYYAQTLQNLGHKQAAVQAYRTRVALGGWREEVFESLMRIGQLSEEPPELMHRAFFDAWRFASHRAEPLCALAQLWIDVGAYNAAFIYARRACELPYPIGDILFVNSHDWGQRRFELLSIASWHVGEFVIGEQAALKALQASPGDPRLLRNLDFYRTR